MTDTQALTTPHSAPPAKLTIWPQATSPNTPASLLTSWTALEALSPQTYKSPEDLALGQRTIAPLGSTPPWTTGEKPKKKDHTFYYQVVLGNVQVDKATAALARTFDPDSEEDPQEGVKASIAVFMLDSRGVLLKEKLVAISSYAWALPKALEGDLAALGEWSTLEQGLIEALTAKLALTDQEGRRLPVTAATIKVAYDWLVATLGLSPEMIRARRSRSASSTRRRPRTPPKSTCSTPSSSKTWPAPPRYCAKAAQAPRSPATWASSRSSKAPTCSTTGRHSKASSPPASSPPHAGPPQAATRWSRCSRRPSMPSAPSSATAGRASSRSTARAGPARRHSSATSSPPACWTAPQPWPRSTLSTRRLKLRPIEPIPL